MKKVSLKRTKYTFENGAITFKMMTANYINKLIKK